MSDAKDEINAIVIKAQNGDTEAMEYILNKYRGCVWKQVRKYYIRSGDYQDIFQEGLIGLWMAIKKYKPMGVPFICFANMCIKNYIRDLVRRDNAKKQAILNNYMQVSDLNTMKDNIETDEIVIAKEKIKKILSSLNKVEYNVAKLTAAGFNVTEIANRIKLSKKTIYHTRVRINKKIKK